MAPSITHRFAARGMHADISPACESLMRGDERPVRTNSLSPEERFELFKKARSVAMFYHEMISRDGRRLEFTDSLVFTAVRQYARHLAHALRRTQLTRSAKQELSDWLEIDRRMPQLRYEYV